MFLVSAAFFTLQLLNLFKKEKINVENERKDFHSLKKNNVTSPKNPSIAQIVEY